MSDIVKRLRNPIRIKTDYGLELDRREAADRIEQLEALLRGEKARNALLAADRMLDLTPVGPGETVDDALSRQKSPIWEREPPHCPTCDCPTAADQPPVVKCDCCSRYAESDEIESLRRLVEVHKADAEREIGEANDLAAKCDALQADNERLRSRLADWHKVADDRSAEIVRLTARLAEAEALLDEALRLLSVMPGHGLSAFESDDWWNARATWLAARRS